MLRKIFFALFFVSGFCTLLYQVIWLRLAFANFGINVQVISVVVSVFMLGLVLGSWVSGRFLIKLARRHRIASLFFYGLAEAGIGVGAFVVPKLFLVGHSWLLTLGQTNSASYLMLSTAVLAISILPWSFLMGTTIPLAMDYVNQRLTRDKNIFSYLYLANSLGAMSGIVITVLVLIEIFGFRHTLLLASVLNFSIAAISVIIASRFKNNLSLQVLNDKVESFVGDKFSYGRRFIFGLLFTTGFVSMGFEVVWSRLFTPVLKTSVYAFAFVLFLYLLGTCFGVLKYRNDSRRNKVLPTRFLLLLFAGSSISQIWFTDPRINLGIIGVFLSILTISFVLGYLTPKQIDKLSRGDPNVAGQAYAINLLGCILGPLVASYLLLPLVGSKLTILLLSIPIVLFFVRKGYEKNNLSFSHKRAMTAMLIFLVVTAIFGTTYEENLNVSEKIIKNDYNATVIAGASQKNNIRSKALIVNGIPMTSLTPITKIMAHLPLSFQTTQPQKALVIALGMGTTFRSVASWGIDTTAIELTPSVKDLFPYFFADANVILSNPKNRIVIDDGRRFLQRTSDKYDLIAVDPPPPVEAAGSSLLYSKQFYEIVAQRLNLNGVLSQWYPAEPSKTLQAVARSLVEVFSYVQVYQSVEGWGYHFFASQNPIVAPTAEKMVEAMPSAAQADLMEWNDHNNSNVLDYTKRILSTPKNIKDFLSSDQTIEVTDDRPYNEYFLLRSIE